MQDSYHGLSLLLSPVMHVLRAFIWISSSGISLMPGQVILQESKYCARDIAYSYSLVAKTLTLYLYI